METEEPDQIAELFANLTGHLEDAVELAASGQLSKLSSLAIKQLPGELGQQLVKCCDALEHIKRRMQS